MEGKAMIVGMSRRICVDAVERQFRAQKRLRIAGTGPSP